MSCLDQFPDRNPGRAHKGGGDELLLKKRRAKKRAKKKEIKPLKNHDQNSSEKKDG